MNRSKLYLSGAVWVVLFAIPLALSGFAADPITGAEDAEGWGAGATGGYGLTVVEADTFTEYNNAIKAGDCYIKLTGNINCNGEGSAIIGTGDNITIDGQGLYKIYSNTMSGQRMCELKGENIVIKDVRFRNSGDNISFKSPANKILLSHVTTTGSYDDGMSISYGTTDVTIQYCAFFGNTRSLFIKYDAPSRISIHHCWFKAQWIRGPWVNEATYVDCRNNLQEDWESWGGPRFENGATGNCIGTSYYLSGNTNGDSDSTCYIYGSGETYAYFDGNAFTGCYPRDDNLEQPVSCPSVTTQSAEDAEDIVRASAGCLPRTNIDMEYITATTWPTVNDGDPWRIDGSTLGPAVWVYGPESPTGESPIVFDIEFTASVTGLTAGEIQVTGGAKGSLSGSGASYSIPVTPSGDGTVTCYVPEDVAQDGSSRDNYESNVCSVVYATPGPTCTVTGPASPTSTSPINFTINFSASVTGLTAAEINVTNGTKGTLTGSGSGPYTLPVTPTTWGNVSCQVPEGAAQDAGSKDNEESNNLVIVYEEDYSEWTYSKKLRFAGYTGTLANFPLFVKLDMTVFDPEDFEEGGADLRFTDAGGSTLLDYEIETWDVADESAIWVKVPEISSSNDYIEMYWGKSGATSRENREGVWTNDFQGVWHLDSSFEDSTAAERDATNYGTTVGTSIQGYGIWTFDAVSDYVEMPADAGSSEEGSLSCWIKTSNDFSDLGIIFYMRGVGGTSAGSSLGNGLGGQYELHLNFTADEKLQFFIEGGTTNEEDVYITTENSYSTQDWYHVVATWEKPGTCYLYVNGDVVGSTSHIGDVFDFDQFIALGKPEVDTRYYKGSMDEARLCTSARSAAWVEACYLNQKRNSTFIAYEDL